MQQLSKCITHILNYLAKMSFSFKIILWGKKKLKDMWHKIFK